MSQINLHVTPKFEEDLALLMRELRTRNKSQAIRDAVHTVARFSRKIAAIEARAATCAQDPQCAAGGGGAAAAGAAAAAGGGAAAAPGGGAP